MQYLFYLAIHVWVWVLFLRILFSTGCRNKLCLAWGLSVCLSEQVMFGMGFVCLSVGTSYVWHGVCLFVRRNKLCLAWGLSVASIAHKLFLEYLVVLKRTVS